MQSPRSSIAPAGLASGTTSGSTRGTSTSASPAANNATTACSASTSAANSFAASLTAKPLIATLMVLSVIATALLAVALTEPTPAAAQGTTTDTMVTVKPKTGTVSALADNIRYTLVAGGCDDPPGTAPAAQDQTDGTTATDGGRTHKLDNRCNWQVTFCGATAEPANRATVHVAAPIAEGTGFELAKDAANRQVTYTSSAQGATAQPVNTLNFTKAGDGCAVTTTIAVKPKTGADSALEDNVRYTLVPSNCVSGVATPASQDHNSGADISGSIGREHTLDFRCDWQVRFCGATVEPARDTTAHVATPVAARTAFTLAQDTANFQLSYTASSETDKQVNTLLFATAGDGCSNTTTVTVKPATGSDSALAANVEYTLTPLNCALDVATTPDRQTHNSGTAASNGAREHLLDFRCDWQVTVCGATATPARDSTAHTATPIAAGTAFTLAQDTTNFQLLYTASSETDQQANTVNFTAAPAGCVTTTTVTVTPKTVPGTTPVSAIAANVSYTLTPLGCDAGVITRPASQDQADGASVSVDGVSGIGRAHQLNYRCDWLVKFCGASVVPSRGVVSHVSPAIAADAAFTLARNTAAGQLAFESSRQVNQQVDTLRFDAAAGGSCSTTTVIVRPTTGDTSALATNVAYTLAASNCNNPPVTAPAGQDHNSGVSVSGGGRAHELDFRCDWDVTVCGATAEPAQDATSHAATPIASDTEFKLNKDATNQQLTYTSSAPGATAQPVNTLNFTATDSGCAAEVRFSVVGSAVAALNAGLNYALVPSNCDADVTTPASQDATHGEEVSAATLKHLLDYRCDWTVTVCGAEAEPVGNSAPRVASNIDPYMAFELNKDVANAQLTYTSSAPGATAQSVDTVNLEKVGLGCVTTVRIAVSPATGTDSALDDNIKYTLVPSNCANTVLVMPGSHTQNSGASASNGVRNHDLDYRCDWDVTVCGATVVPARGATELRATAIAAGTGFKLTKDLTARMLTDEGADSAHSSNESLNQLNFTKVSNGCADTTTTVTVTPKTGSESALVAGLTYTLAAVNCDDPPGTAPAGQDQADGISVTGGGRAHELDYRCDWEVTVCGATAAPAKDTTEHVATPFADNTKFTLNKDDTNKQLTYTSSAPSATAQEVNAVLFTAAPNGCSDTTLEVWPRSTGETNANVTQFSFFYQLMPECPADIPTPPTQITGDGTTTRITGVRVGSGTQKFDVITHNLNSHCDWSITICGGSVDLLYNATPNAYRGVHHGTIRQSSGPFELLGDPGNRQLVFPGSQQSTQAVNRLQLVQASGESCGAAFSSLTTEVQVTPGLGISGSAVVEKVAYTFTPENCAAGITPPGVQTQANGRLVDDLHLIHELDFRCNWNVSYSLAEGCGTVSLQPRLDHPHSAIADATQGDFVSASTKLFQDLGSRRLVVSPGSTKRVNRFDFSITRCGAPSLPADTTAIVVQPANSADTEAATAAGVVYYLTPTACAPGVTKPAIQSNADGSTTGTATTHNLDYRCDWQVQTCGASVDVLEDTTAKGTISGNSFTLTRAASDDAENKLVYRASAQTDKQVDVIAFTAHATTACFLVQPAAAGATEPATEAGFYYLFVEQNCVDGILNQSNSDGFTVGTVTVHALRNDCHWDVYFCGGTVELFDDTTLKGSISGNTFDLEEAAASMHRMTYQASTDTDKNINIMAFTSADNGCDFDIQIRDAQATPADRKTIANLGIAYTIVPRDCLNDIDAPASQTQADGTLVDATDKGLKHTLDIRCTWDIDFSDLNVTGSTNEGCQVGIAPAVMGAFGASNREAFSQTGDMELENLTDSVTLEPNPANLSLFVVTTKARDVGVDLSTYIVNRFRLTIDDTMGCATPTTVTLLDGAATSPQTLAALEVDYTLTPVADSCDAGQGYRPVQTRADATVTATINYGHKLDSKCSWEVEFTNPAKCVAAKIENAPTGGGAPTTHVRTVKPFQLTKDATNSRLVYGPVADAKVVNQIRLDVGNVADGECVTPLGVVNAMVSDTARGIHTTDLSISFASMRSKQECTPNALSDDPTTLTSIPYSESRNFLLATNCNWLITFGSDDGDDDETTDNNCPARVEFYTPSGGLQDQLFLWPRDDSHPGAGKGVPVFVQARPGETQTIRLTGNGTRLTYRDTEITALRFTGCSLSNGLQPITITDSDGTPKTMAALGVTYEFEAVRCRSIGLPDTQDAGDAVVKPTNQYIHLLSLWCDWKVTFTHSSNCEVSVRARNSSNQAFGMVDTDGVVELRGRHPTDASGGFLDGQVKLVLTVNDTDDSKCAPLIELRNTATAHLEPAVLEFKPVDASDSTMACTPNERGPDPDDATSGTTSIAAGATLVVPLARNCNWEVKFKVARDKNCEASAQLKDADGDDIGSALTIAFADTSKNETFTLTKAAAGLQYTPTGGSATTVAAIDFDPCIVDATTEALKLPVGYSTVTVSILGESSGLTDYTWTTSSADCNIGAEATPAQQTQADGIVTAEGRAHHLRTNCNWTLTFTSPATDCDVHIITVHPSGHLNGDVGQPPESYDNTVELSNAGGSEFRVSWDGGAGVSAADKVIAALKYTDSDCPRQGIRFVNKSAPFAVADDGSYYHLMYDFPDENPRDQLHPLTYSSPQVALNFTPVGNLDLASETRMACTAAAGTDKPTQFQYLDALELQTTSEDSKVNKPVLDANGEFMFNEQPQSFMLDHNCSWEIEFVSVFTAEFENAVTGTLPDCVAAATIKDPSGAQLGYVQAALPYLGGEFILDNAALGNTGGLAFDGRLVGSIEFLGCLAEDYPYTSEIQIHDGGGGAKDGNNKPVLAYTIAPAKIERPLTAQEKADGETVALKTTCQGFAPPPAQTKADGLVYDASSDSRGNPQAFSHFLNYGCDWDVTFENVDRDCAAVSIWGYELVDNVIGGETVSVETAKFIEAVPVSLSAGDATPEGMSAPRNITVRLTQAPTSGPAGGFVYYLGSNGASQVDPREKDSQQEYSQLGIPDGNAPEADEDSDTAERDDPADPGTAMAVVALSLECASVIEFNNISGTIGPELNLQVTTTPTNPATAPLGCRTHDRLPNTDTLEAGESFSLALNNKCDWQVSIPAGDCGADLAVRVRDTIAAPMTATINSVLRPADGTSAVNLTLTKHADGLQYEDTDGTDKAVGSVEFFNCYNPLALIDRTFTGRTHIANAMAGDKIDLAVTQVGSVAGCSIGGTYTLVLGEGVRIDLSDTTRTTLKQYLAVGPQLEAGDTLPKLVGRGTDADATLCRYRVTATAQNPSTIGTLMMSEQLTSYQGYSFVDDARFVPLTLRNTTVPGTPASVTAARADVTVTITPSQFCAQGVPAGSPFILNPVGGATPSIAAMLEFQDCVWTVAFTSSSCDVSAQLRSSTAAAIGAADTDGELEITTRLRAADSTPVASIEFTVTACRTVDPTTTPTITVPASCSTRPTVGRMLTVTGTAAAAAEVVVSVTQDGASETATPVTGEATEDGSGGWTVTLNVSSLSGNSTITATASEASKSNVSVTCTVTIDSTVPTVTVGLDKTTVEVDGTFKATFTLTEAPPTSGDGAFTAADVTVSGTGTADTGTLTKEATPANTYTMVLTARTAGSLMVEVEANKFTDMAGNNNPAAQSPSLSVTQATTTTPVITMINGAAVVANATVGRTVVVKGTAETGATVAVAIDNDATTATATGSDTADGSGNWEVTLNLTGTWEGADGTNNAATISARATIASKQAADAAAVAVTVDTIGPTVALTVSPSIITFGSANDEATVTITLGEAPFERAQGASADPKEFTADDVTVAPAAAVTKGTLTQSQSNPLEYTLVLTAQAVTTTTRVTVAVPAGSSSDSSGFTDAAGNYNSAAPTGGSFDVRLRATSIPTITEPARDATVGGTAVTVIGTGESGATITLTAEARSATCGSGSSLGTATVAFNGNWTTTVDLTALSDGDAKLSALASRSERANAGPICHNIVIDNTAPTATIVLDSSSIVVGSTATATITLSDAPASGTAFDASDVTVTGVAPSGAVTKGAFAQSQTNSLEYTLVLHGMAVTTTAATITVVQGAFQDSLGRSNEAVTETLSVTTTTPTATPTPTFSAPGDGDTVGGAAVTVSGTGGSGAAVAVSLSPTGNNPCAAGTNLNPAGASLNPATVGSNGEWSTTVDLSSQSDGAAVLSITATESGKANAGPVCRDIVIDNTAPTATLELDQSSIAVGSTATATITLSDAPASGTAFDASDITVTGFAPPGAVTKGTFAPTANSDNKIYTLVLNGVMATTTAATITVVEDAFKDAAGNSNAAVTETLSVTTSTPTATATPMISTPAPNSLNDRTFTVTGTAEKGADVSVTLGSGATRTAPLTDKADGTVSSDATLGAWSVTFALTDGQFPVTAPAVSSTQTISVTATNTAASKTISAAQTRSIMVDSKTPSFMAITNPANLEVDGTVVVKFIATEPIDNFDSVTDITNSASTIATLSEFTKLAAAAVSGTEEYTVKVTAHAAGTATFSVAADVFSDPAGNGNAATTSSTGSFTVTVNAAGASSTPTVALAAASDGGAKGDNKTNDNSPEFTVTGVAANAVVVLNLVDNSDTTSIFKRVTVPAGANRVSVDLGDGQANCGPRLAGPYTSVCDTLGDDTWSVTAEHTDGSKTTATSAAVSLEIETTKPTVTVAVRPTSVTAGGAATATFTLSEAPAASGAGAFAAADVTVAPANAVASRGALTPGANNTYTMELTTAATASGNVTVAVAAGAFTDVFGNTNTASNTDATLTVGQAVTPTPVITGVSDGDLVGRMFSVTVTFPEDLVATTQDTVTLTLGSGASQESALAQIFPGSISVRFNLDDGQFPVVAPAVSSRQTLSVTAQMLGKAPSPAVEIDLMVDSKSPTVAVALDPASVQVGGTTTATFTLSEPAATSGAGAFTANDVTVSSAAGRVDKGTLTKGAGNTYTMVLTARAAGRVTVTVAADKFTDVAGNNNLAATAATLNVTAVPDTVFSGSVSVSVTDNLDREISSGNHSGTAFAVSVSPSGSNAASCSATRTVTIRLGAGSSASAPVAGLINSPGGGAACVYNVSFPTSMNSAGTGNYRVSLVRQSVTSATLRAAAPTAAASYVATEIQFQPQPVSTGVSVANAPAVTEGEALQFRVSAPGPVTQAVEVDYTFTTVAIGLGAGTGRDDSPAAMTGKVTIDAGQSSAIIEVPIEDNDLDQPNRRVEVTLTSASGVGVDPNGRTATGLVKDDDPPPELSLEQMSLHGNELRFTVSLSEESSYNVRFNYSTSLGLDGTSILTAGQTRLQVKRTIPTALLARVDAVRLRLSGVQYAIIDLSLSDLLVFPGGSWRFHAVTRDGVTPAQIAARLVFPAGWRLHAWDSAAQRWQPYSATNGANTTLAEGTAIVFRGAWYSVGTLRSAGLGRSDEITLNPGWNIFLPAADALDVSSGDFTTTSRGGSAVLFDPSLVDCSNLGGVLVIYTYNQLDPRTRNGFRLALPCHPQLQERLDYPTINTIGESDTLYVWFYNTTPVDITFTDGLYTPA